ncbi:hypothetical protein PsorP6_008091 [Peronosclerospora sorghi]|uniref:Uncharacterized protein n=1 Tax=Peronosclerospora sorghi TaxID=230839 RepID=A0ACC0W8Z9_9STRA|nr:hypothetical protein PsorP6_008091 [Peronosclerospora sorghi]
MMTETTMGLPKRVTMHSYQSRDGEDGVIEEEDLDIERQLWGSLASAEDEEVADDDDLGANGVSRPRKFPPS